ncbi:MAG: DUF190 domain-containing protein [Dehalococcoidia bacterium]
METPGQGVLLRIFVGESDRWQGESLYLALVKAAKNQGLAGATVLRGIAGFGAHSRIHTTRLVDISPDLSMVVEIVDDEPKIKAFLPVVQQMVQEGLITWEPVNVIMYRHRDSNA